MSTTAVPALPDVNAEIHPFPVVQYWIDRTADYFLFADPDEEFSENAWLTPDRRDYFGINGGYGIHFRSRLRAFDSRPVSSALLRDQSIGDELGGVECLCLFGPGDLPWTPADEPEPRIYDPYRSRKFAIREIAFRLGGESCTGYGVGRTYPQFTGEPVTMAGGVGNITAGTGRFEGLEGTFVMSGVFTPDLGFRGQITLRMVDPSGRFTSSRQARAVSNLAGGSLPESFFVFRGEKKDRTVRTVFGTPRGNEQCLITPSQMRSIEFAAELRGGKAYASITKQSVTATMDASVYFNLFAPPGTAADPVPFTTEEVYSFLERSGPEPDVVRAEVRDGISFKLTIPDAPDQPAVRFAGFGPITGGNGAFSGAGGMLTVNSIIGISPHVLSLIHVLHVLDPERKFQAARDRSCG